jgi:lactoylglutathione lyase
MLRQAREKRTSCETHPDRNWRFRAGRLQRRPGCGADSAPAPEAAAAPPHKDPLLSAVGIGVGDLAKSADFHVNVMGMGMEKTRSIEIDDMDDEILRYPDGESYLVLMHWTDGSARNCKDLPIKIVTRVKEPVALTAKTRAAGDKVTREPQPSAQVGGAIVGFAKDPDSYMLELLSLRQPASATPAQN